jgi:hypothetical protein
MSYYPILSAPYCTGKTILYNFSPNNWEPSYKGKQYVNLTYIQDGSWRSFVLDELNYQAFKAIYHDDVISLIPEGGMPLLSLSRTKLPKNSKQLPAVDCNHTVTPEYRATLGLKSNYTETSYQGELNPFPSKASLLTFSPFLQFGDGIENYLLLLNLEKTSENREVEIEIYDAYGKELKKTQNANNNQINAILLDDIGFDDQSLPVVICREMAFIPIYFSSYKQGKMLSLEHSHPPASFVVQGNRFGSQRNLKDYWLSKLSKL